MITRQAVTAEQFYKMPDVPGKRFELVNGELVAVPSPGAMHNLIAGLLYRLPLKARAEREGRDQEQAVQSGLG